MNWEPPDVQAGFRKGRGTRDQIDKILCIIEKVKKFQKCIHFCFIDYVKAFVWITTNSGKLCKRWEYQTTLPASWETYAGQEATLRTRHGTMDLFTGKEYNKAVYHYPAYLTYAQSMSYKLTPSSLQDSMNVDPWLTIGSSSFSRLCRIQRS